LFSIVEPVVISPLAIQFVSVPDPAVINCTATGLPRPNITWAVLQDDVPTIISPTDTARFTTSTFRGTDHRQTTSILTVSNPQPALARIYVCDASNFIGNDSADFILVVHCKFRVLSQSI